MAEQLPLFLSHAVPQDPPASETRGLDAADLPETDQPVPQPGGQRLDLDPEGVRNGLGQLVLTLVKLLHELMERQALRRMDAGSLSDAEIEAIGTTLMRQAEEIDRLRAQFHLDDDDLNLDLGPLGKLL